MNKYNIATFLVTNELEHLEEWYVHHRNRGFENFFIYVDLKVASYLNKISENLKSNIKKLRLVDINHYSQLLILYTKFCLNHPEFDYILFIDSDEYYESKTNNVNIDLGGVDSTSKLNKSHIGIFNMLRGNTFSLLTNAAIVKNRYNVSRTVQGIFNNESSVTGQEWWVNNRLFWHAHKNITPFVGHTVRNYGRDAFTENGSIQSARSVDAINETYHTGEIGLTLSHRFGGKKQDLFGVSVEGSYATDNSVEVAASVDYKEMVFIEGVHQIVNGASNTAVAAKFKFRF
jgi:hypothetical protein